MIVPVGWLSFQSIYDGGFTLEHYRRIFSEDIYWRSFALTFRIAVMVTVITLLLGYPLAYAAVRARRPWDVLILACVILPFWTSVLVRGLCLARPASAHRRRQSGAAQSRPDR